jgi:Domain of unknown function (DUF4399)
MKKLIFMPAFFLLGLVSCNSGSSNSSSSSDTTNTMKSDTSKMMATSSTIEPLPPVPAGARVYFKNLKNGETVTSPVKIEMVAVNIAVDSAGKIRPNSGHFHILIDAGDSVATGIVIPKDSAHIHFGDAQKEAVIKLTPGKHRLALQFADGIHRSYGSELSEAITINVRK